MTEAEVKARKILRNKQTRKATAARNIYFYKGQRYTIVEGRCLTPEEADQYEQERKRGH